MKLRFLKTNKLVIQDISIDRFKEGFDPISSLTGADFFDALVKMITENLGVDAAWIAEYNKDQKLLLTQSFWYKNKYIDNYTYSIEGTPCEDAIDQRTLLHIEDNILELYESKMLHKMEAVSYIGLPLEDEKRNVIGHIAILHSQPIQKTPALISIFKIFGSRSQAELERLRKERNLVQQQLQLRELVNGLSDALINLNSKLQITMINRVAEKLLHTRESEALNLSIFSLLNDESKTKIESQLDKVRADKAGNSYLQIPGTFEIRSKSGEFIKTQAILSKYEWDDKCNFTIVLKNKDEVKDVEKTDKLLIHQTAHVNEGVADLKTKQHLIGESKLVKRLFQDIYLVAHTDATVLINGETGTGKELVARQIHGASNRFNQPMIPINCGAIPPNLIESELFGHEKGAFTGATGTRKGRFSLAHKGTIFLDEIGELPLELQVKLLRVIQEGEFDPVGSMKTQKVDVRVIAATHRNLKELVSEGKFREDLYYRLNVFPIVVPPLRERGDDITLLANTFLKSIAERENKKIKPLTLVQEKVLKTYDWPGNVRELQNIMERAVILATDEFVKLSTLLGVTTNSINTSVEQSSVPDNKILTRDELLEFEKQNIIKALEATNWKVSGSDGAAKMLGMVPSTLSSRITTLNIKKT